MLTREFVTKYSIPYEAGEWVELKMPSFTDLKVAREAAQVAGLKLVSQLGVDGYRALQAAKADQSDDGSDDPDPLSGIDELTLVKRCLRGWSYDTKVSDDAIESLDERTLKWVALELVNTVPSRSEDDKLLG